MPFFGTYMGRNTFQAILSNLQVLDSTLDLPHDHICHDPLYKVRPMLDMMDRTFVQSYKSGRDLSFDEGCCPYKGRVIFRCYNPKKPAKWHLKMFEVSDSRTGYVIAFDIYTGKNKTRCALNADVLDPQSTQTTKVVLGLMKKGNLLGRGHHVYMDNYYSSPDLFLSSIVRRYFLVVHAEKIAEICQKLSLKLYSKRKVIVYLEGMALC